MTSPTVPSSRSRWSVLLRLARSAIARRLWSGAFLLGAAYLIYRQVAGMSVQGFLHALASTGGPAIGASILLTTASYLCLSGTEWLALNALGHRLPYRRAALVAVPAYALTNSAGFSPATGTALRIQLYGARGLTAVQSTAVAMLAGTAVTLSGCVIAGFVLALDPGLFTRAFREGRLYVALVGVVMMLPAALWFLAFRPGAPHWLGGGRSGSLSLPTRLFGLAAGLGDWLFSGAALFVLLPQPDLAVFPSFFVAYTAGCLLSAATGVPGGIGVFEAIVLSLTGLFSTVHETAAALLLYRCIYSLGPLSIIILYTGGRRLSARLRGWRRAPAEGGATPGAQPRR